MESCIWCLVTEGWQAPSPIWAAVTPSCVWQQTRHSLLTNYYKQNTTQQFSQPRPHHSSSPRLWCPASSWKQRNEFIIHQKGSEQLDGEHQHRDQHLPGVCSPPSLGPALLTTASNRPCLFLTTLDHSGQRFNMHPVAVSLNTDRIIKQQTSFN